MRKLFFKSSLTKTVFAVITVLFAIAPSFADEAKPLKVVASFSVLGDFVHEIGGARVSVSTLVGPNGDVHVYQPTPADSKTLTDADLIIVNGLGLEGWMSRLIKASNTKAKVVVATYGITPRHMETEEIKGDDPHAWQSAKNAEIYVKNIAVALSAQDPDGAATYTANLARYTEALESVDKEILQTIAQIPTSKRVLITTHDAFGYYAARYGLTFLAPEGVSTESEASAKDIAKIIRQIKAEHIPAVFLENVSNPALMQSIAKESGAAIGETLYSDALSKQEDGAGTYLEMMRHNLAAFKKALMVAR